MLGRLAVQRASHIRCDNDPELTAHVLRDWCRFSAAQTAFIEPGSRRRKAWGGVVNARVRDELLDTEQFSCLAEARVVARGLQLLMPTSA
jgi:hypothetical protein